MCSDAHADYEENVFFPLVKSIADDQDAKQLIRIGFETHAKWRMMYNTIKNKVGTRSVTMLESYYSTVGYAIVHAMLLFCLMGVGGENE